MAWPDLGSDKRFKALASVALVTLVLGLIRAAFGPLIGIVDFALTVLLIVLGMVGAYGVLKLALSAVRRALWRVRHRMVAVFFFVGVLPLGIAAVLVVLVIQLLLAPLTAYVVTSKFTEYGERMNAAADALLWQLRETPAADLLPTLEQFRDEASDAFPEAAFLFLRQGATWAFPEGGLAGPVPSNLPETGAVVQTKGRVLVVAAAQNDAEDARLVIAVPVTEALAARLAPGIGILAVDTGGPNEQTFSDVDSYTENIGLPPPQHPFDWDLTWRVDTEQLVWETDRLVDADYWLRTRLSALLDTVFAQQDPGAAWFFSFAMIALLAALGTSLVISLVIAASLTRTLTAAVNDLYVGTTHVNRGDYGYRIPVRGTDQISHLSRSFNAMTSSVEKSIEDTKRRQQLEAELDVAREVQARLFPARPPVLDGLEVLGICRPAQSVSGDFFDYVALERDVLAISFGDVSGKGISAALVMASLHSIVRSQLAILRPDGSSEMESSVARVVKEANRQLCDGTSPEKYSTLLFGAYDARSGTLTYSNAGHLPPLLVRNGQITPLEVNGMVVGLFPDAPYTASTVQLRTGDLLVAFTDGVTEPENAESDDYGEERLRHMLRQTDGRSVNEIIEGVMTEVLAWTGQATLQDDMTMLAVRKR